MSLDYVTRVPNACNGHASSEIVISSSWDRLPPPGLPEAIANMEKRRRQLLASMRQECQRRTHGTDQRILARAARISRAFAEYQVLTTQVLAAELL